MFSVDTCAVMAKPGIILDHTTENGFGTRGGGGGTGTGAGGTGTGTGTGASGGGNGDDMMIVYML